MSPSILEYEMYFTNNLDIPNSYFEMEISKGDNLEYLKLMYSYFLIKRGFIDKAESLIENIELNTSNSYYRSLKLMNEGLIASYKSRDGIAKEKFDLALELDTSDINKWLRIELYFYKPTAFQAFGFLEKALQIDNNFYLAKIEKSYQLDENMNCIEIINLLKNIPDTYQDSDAMNLLGVSYINCRQFEKAKNALNKSISCLPSSNNYYSLAKLTHEYYGDFDKSEQLFLESLKLDANNLDAVNGYAWLLYDKGEVENAEVKFLNLLKYTNDEEIYIQVINFFLLINKFDTASSYIIKNEVINGKSYISDGYNIILNINKKEPYKHLVTKFKSDYPIEDVEWLKNQIVFFFGEVK